jgi:hypothetical protein
VSGRLEPVSRRTVRHINRSCLKITLLVKIQPAIAGQMLTSKIRRLTNFVGGAAKETAAWGGGGGRWSPESHEAHHPHKER